jgi:cytochrome P450
MSGQFENEVIPVTGAVRGQGGAHTARFVEKHHVATNSTGESGETRLDRSFFQDPHSFYRRLRDAAPATRVRMWGDVPVWLITQYDEARTLLSDSRLSKDFHGALALFPPGGAGAHGSLFNKTMLHMDPPDHTRLRRLVVKAFTPRVVEGMTARIAEIADELLDGVAAAANSGPVDLMESFAAPLPMRVIGELLGVPTGEGERFRNLVDPLLTRLDPAETDGAQSALSDLLQGLIASKRQTPGQDLLTALVAATEDNDRLSEDELLAMTYLLILAGYETTVNLIGNGVLALLQNPSQLALLRDDPAGRIPDAVEEFLRYESPVNIATLRFTTVPIRVGSVDIPAGEFVQIALPAANRDGNRFDEPDQLDIRRKPNPHLTFGHGIHYCLGAPLARLEGQIALARLLARFDQMALPSPAELQYRPSTLMRGLKSLPVLFGDAARGSPNWSA